MDDKWFKQKQKIAGVTAADIAQVMGRDRSAVSHIMTGRQRMSLDWAKAFAKTLKVPIDEVLEKAGALEHETARPLTPGFAEGDAAPFDTSRTPRISEMAKVLGYVGGGIDIWRVKSNALASMGYVSGDFILVNTKLSERTASGDVVLAQIYDNNTGTAITVLRRHEPPVLLSFDAVKPDYKVHVVDHTNVVICGKVIASWRLSDGSI